MMKLRVLFLILIPFCVLAQDLSEGLVVNDFTVYEMQDVDKPEYLETIIDPTFGTTIRRITNTAAGEVIVPMYSTIQAWNSDETYMILYNQSLGLHVLLDGMNYEFMRNLDDVNPMDLEQIFWDFDDPLIFYYPENQTNDFVKYDVVLKEKEVLTNLQVISACMEGLSMGNDIQMMSWDSDVFTFRCGNSTAYSYRISTGEVTAFSISELLFAAPAVAPSGELFYHDNAVYNNLGNQQSALNKSSVEHSCVGRLTNGNDALYSIAFAEGPQGGCIGDIIAHDLTNGECIPIISQSQGYDYPQSGTHISALAHQNTEGGWVAASMIGYDQDGKSLLDQELVIAKIEDTGETTVCRIGHHRSDEDQFDYWGEPHAVISPKGTRVLFGSDWSGAQDGESVDSYVVELPSFSPTVSIFKHDSQAKKARTYPNPTSENLQLAFENHANKSMELKIYNSQGKESYNGVTISNTFEVSTTEFSAGVYFYEISYSGKTEYRGRFIKH